MKFLKGLALSLLGFLLFLSLTILGLALTLNNTILNPDFVISELENLDVSSLAKEALSEQIPQEGAFMAEALDDTVTDLEPWIKEQAGVITYSSYDYLFGKSQNLSVVISLEPVKEKLRDNVREAVLQSPPPELAGVPPAMIEQYFDEFYQGFAKEIPSTFELDERLLGPEVMGTLEQVRQGIGYYQIGYKVLIGFILLLILGIILLNRQVKGATRKIGTIFLTYGAIEYAGIYATKYFAATQLSWFEIPSSLQAWIPQLLNDFLAPLETFSLGLLIGGAALLIVSFVYRRGRTVSPDSLPDSPL